MAIILEGAPIRDRIKEECRPRIERIVHRLGRPPGLSVVLAGHNSASQVYVTSKTRTAKEIGMQSETIAPDESSSTEELLEIVQTLNNRADVDGILVQLPLPSHVDAARVLLAVAPQKDVDGFHPYNVGLLSTGRPGLRPCTPSGIMQMLHRHQIAVAGKRAVVVGRSDIVGKPMAMLLLAANATVTIAHSRTPDLQAVCQEADILVAAIGRPAMIARDYIKPGAVVIDVGMNTLTERAEVERLFGRDAKRMANFDKNGRTLVGDVDPAAMAELASAYTPVPGGVGPLTIAMLMANTVEACERSYHLC